MTSTPETLAPPSIPGPVERVPFFEAQRRHRRGSLVLTALCALTVLAMGGAAAVLATPAVVVTLAIALGAARLVLPLPQALWAPIEGYMDAYGIALAGEPGEMGRLAAAVVVLAPGVVVALVVWLALWRWLLASGVDGMVHALGARELRPGDLEERQLANVASEVAVACGVRAPRVLLVDGAAANAGVIGTSPDDATVVVARRLLDELDRAETQAVVAHLVGSAANGDLRGSLLLVSVFQTMSVVLTLLDAPMSAPARAALREVWTKVWRRRAADPADVERVARVLAERFDAGTMDEVTRFLDFESARGIRRPLKLARAMLFLPLALFGTLAKVLVLLTVLFVLGPLLALALRSRRYLADATAVELTRNPDALARALTDLAARGGVIDAGRWLEHLFIVGPEAVSARLAAAHAQALQQLATAHAEAPLFERALRTWEDAARLAREHGERHEKAHAGGFARRHGIVVALHPTLERRIARLAALGARR
ncbi:MAG TPA: M48 family metalloprotease [Candidatus Binatia bacterium]